MKVSLGLFAILTILKLTGCITCSWWIVTCPLWIYLAFFIFIFIPLAFLILTVKLPDDVRQD